MLFSVNWVYPKGADMENQKTTIHAVHDRDVTKLWDSLQLPESQPCFVCRKKVTKENVGAFLPVKGKVEVVCEEPHCFLEMHYKKQQA